MRYNCIFLALTVFVVIICCINGHYIHHRINGTYTIHQKGPVTMIVPASGHQVRCISWVQMGTFKKELGFNVDENSLH